MAKSLFVVLDGMDGTGKSEMAKLLHKYFSKNKKYRVLATMEPSNGKYGSKIRKILGEEKEPLKNAEKLLELFIKDRQEHLKNAILPFLEADNIKCNIVICDRYYYSTIAFQYTQGLSLKKIIEKNKSFRKPDIAFILDIPAETALERIKHRKKEKFEQLQFMKKLRNNFLTLKKYLKDSIIIIDASQSIEKVFEKIKKEIENALRRF